MYCGDGINDLVALAAADVGMAVGSSHASAAASISDKHSSVAGVLLCSNHAEAGRTCGLALALVSGISYSIKSTLIVLASNTTAIVAGDSGVP